MSQRVRMTHFWISRAASQQPTSRSIASQSRSRQRRREAEGDRATQGTEQGQNLSRDQEYPIPFDDNLPEAVHDPLGPEVIRTVPDLIQSSPRQADAPRWISLDPLSSEASFTSSQSSPRGSKSPVRTPQARIRRPQDLRFCFVADGTALLIWQGEGASCIVKICLPLRKEDCMRGQKLSLAGSMPSEMRVVRVAGGSKIVAVVVSAQDSEYKLLYFDENGRHDPQHDYIERQNPPLSLSVSRDDRRIAVGWGGVVEIYSVVNGQLDQTPMRAMEPPDVSRPHLQVTNFSIDSTELVIASQVNGAHPYRPNVHTSVHRTSQDPRLTLERVDRPEPCQLQVASGAPGVSGVFRLEKSVNSRSPLQPSLLLITQCRGSYATLIAANNSKRHKVIVKEKPILAIAQGPGRGYKSIFVFQSQRGPIWMLDVYNGIRKSVGNFSKDRRGLGWRELKALSVFGEGIAQAFWWSSKGFFVLKRIPINGQGDLEDVEDIGQLYLEIQANG